MTSSPEYDLIITGAGPAGLFLAASLPSSVKTLIIEKKRSPGLKLLISGSGRCNLTRIGTVDELLERYPSGRTFLKKALYSFTNKDLIEWFEKRGVEFIEEDSGKFFPEKGGASAILAALLSAVEEAGHTLMTGSPVVSIKKAKTGYTVETGAGRYKCRMAAISAGGASYPSTGSSGDSYMLARGLGLTVNEQRPALVPVYVEDYPFAELAGISVKDSSITLMRGRKTIRKSRGDILLTHKAFSGPGILNLSGYVMPGDRLKISMVGADAVYSVDRLISDGKGAAVRKALTPTGIPARLLNKVSELSGISSDARCASLNKKEKSLLTENISAMDFHVKKAGSFKEAMVTAGGVDLREIRGQSMEAKNLPGLYVTGEALDFYGETGGLNLQACFSTAFAAASDIKGKAL